MRNIIAFFVPIVSPFASPSGERVSEASAVGPGDLEAYWPHLVRVATEGSAPKAQSSSPASE
jgi:hypothetical protein